MIKEITQEERLDLTDIRQEAEAYNRKFLDYCEVFELDPEKVMQEYFHDIAINSDEYKKLEAENKRLKEQLNKEIHYNRKMKYILELYANSGYWLTYDDRENVFMYGGDGYDLAQQILKEIDNKE